MRHEARLAPTRLDRTIAQVSRLLQPAEQQTGATQCAISPAAMTDDPLLRLTFEQLLALADPV
jgi:hypothetical protein